MDFSNNKSFCVLPWMHIATAPNGDVKPCCISSVTVNKDNGNAFNLGRDSLSDIINSNGYKDIREKMIQGIPVAGCERCYQIEENTTGASYRSQYNLKWSDVPSISQKLMEGTEITETVEYFDLRFGNMCNLNCKSCSPDNSIQYEKELIELNEKSAISSFMEIKPVIDINGWYSTSQFFDNITSQLDNIKELYVTGGEPTIIEKNYEVLEYLIEQDKAKDITLKLNSNMTNMQDRFLNIINQFKHVVFFASIDGFGVIQEYIRYPSKWQQIDKNFKKLISNKKSNISINVTPVIQNVNLGYMVDLFEYIESFNIAENKPVVAISPIILYVPNQLDLTYLPLEYKTYCWDKIQHWIDTKCKFQDVWFTSKMKELKNKCMTDTPYEHELARFREFTNIFDKHRQFYLRDVNPELFDIVYK
jgi:organic radical activating enzyme